MRNILLLLLTVLGLTGCATNPPPSATCKKDERGACIIDKSLQGSVEQSQQGGYAPVPATLPPLLQTTEKAVRAQ